MVAVGITSEGKIIEIDCSYDILHCYSKDLVSLDIPEGVIKVSCHNNKLTELILPDSVTRLICDKEVIGLEEFIGKIDIELW